MIKDQTDELLGKYFDPGNIEKAPEGFTSRTMSRVRMEQVSMKRRKNHVPVISSAVIAGFLIAAILTPGKWIVLPEITLLKDVSIPLSGKLAPLQVPSILTYVVAGVVLITVLDGVLNGYIFKRKVTK
jgi:hypothetical protein